MDHLSNRGAQEALAVWKRKCKQFTDREQKGVLKESETVVDNNVMFTGVTDLRLCTMMEVVGAQIRVKDTFPNRDVLALWIFEEAIQANMSITVTRSNSVQYHVVGINFYAQANKNLTEGWVVSKLQVNVEGAGLVAPPTTDNNTKKQVTTPLRTKWLVRLVLDEICNFPNISKDA